MYKLDPDILLRVGPRLLDGLEAMADIFHAQDGGGGERAGLEARSPSTGGGQE